MNDAAVDPIPGIAPRTVPMKAPRTSVRRQAQYSRQLTLVSAGSRASGMEIAGFTEPSMAERRRRISETASMPMATDASGRPS